MIHTPFVCRKRQNIVINYCFRSCFLSARVHGVSPIRQPCQAPNVTFLINSNCASVFNGWQWDNEVGRLYNLFSSRVAPQARVWPFYILSQSEYNFLVFYKITTIYVLSIYLFIYFVKVKYVNEKVFQIQVLLLSVAYKGNI